MSEERYDPRSREGRALVLGAPHTSGARRGAPGFTEYSVRPRWTPARDGDVCRVATLHMEVRIVIRLPLDVSSGVERWLRRHENGHRRLVEESAAELFEELSEARAPSCPGLSARVDALVRRSADALERAHARYDGVGDGDGFPQRPRPSSLTVPGA